MTLDSQNLVHLCDLAIEAAVSTGRYIASTRPANVEHKDNGGSLAAQVVTEVDRESQARILDGLAPSFDAFDLALLTEESPDDGSRLSKDYFWCIDPIDGTLCFIEGTPGYAVSIALVSRDGDPVIGVVYDPAAGVLYHAIRGHGAFRQREPWRLAARDGPLRIFTDHSELAQPNFAAIERALDADRGPVAGAVMNAIACLENAPALYFKQPKPGGQRGGCFWDFAATAR
ncbi:MAG: inositol monophosphatase family protein, partial [Pseudomonadota bacterium]